FPSARCADHRRDLYRDRLAMRWRLGLVRREYAARAARSEIGAHLQSDDGCAAAGLTVSGAGGIKKPAAKAGQNAPLIHGDRTLYGVTDPITNLRFAMPNADSSGGVGQLCRDFAQGVEHGLRAGRETMLAARDDAVDVHAQAQIERQ